MGNGKDPAACYLERGPKIQVTGSRITSSVIDIGKVIKWNIVEIQPDGAGAAGAATRG